MFKRLITYGLLVASTAVASPAYAAYCATRDTVVERLQSRYSEQLTAAGLQNSSSDQTVVEVWSSPDSGTFTVLVTRADGQSCVVAAGTDFFNQVVVVGPAAIPG